MYAFPHHRGQSICSPTCAEQSEKKSMNIAIAPFLNDDILKTMKNDENFFWRLRLSYSKSSSCEALGYLYLTTMLVYMFTA